MVGFVLRALALLSGVFVGPSLVHLTKHFLVTVVAVGNKKLPMST